MSAEQRREKSLHGRKSDKILWESKSKVEWELFFSHGIDPHNYFPDWLFLFSNIVDGGCEGANELTMMIMRLSSWCSELTVSRTSNEMIFYARLSLIIQPSSSMLIANARKDHKVVIPLPILIISWIYQNILCENCKQCEHIFLFFFTLFQRRFMSTDTVCSASYQHQHVVEKWNYKLSCRLDVQRRGVTVEIGWSFIS